MTLSSRDSVVCATNSTPVRDFEPTFGKRNASYKSMKACRKIVTLNFPFFACLRESSQRQVLYRSAFRHILRPTPSIVFGNVERSPTRRLSDYTDSTSWDVHRWRLVTASPVLGLFGCSSFVVDNDECLLV